MKNKSGLIKRLIIITGALLFFGLLLILLTSLAAKYLIERYDEKYTGRQIKTGWIYTNPFTGYVHISNLLIYESDCSSALKESDSIFFSAKEIYADFAIHKLFSKNVEITEIALFNPKGIIIHKDADFNFSDIIKKFTPDSSAKTQSKIHFNILNIKINNGKFYYHEKIIPVKYSITNVNIESAGMQWDSDSISADFTFLSGTGSGSSKGDFTIYFKNLDYHLAVKIKKYNLKFIDQYLKDLMNFGYFKVKLDADLQISGNLQEQGNINTKGQIVLHDFHLGKNTIEAYASFKKLVVAIKEINPKNHKFYYDSILLYNPYFKYEKYDYLDNLEMMFGKNGSNISSAQSDTIGFNLILVIADYVKLLSKNFFQNDYRLNKLAIHNGCFEANDYSQSEKFSIKVNPFFVFADSVNKKNKWIRLVLKSSIKPYGKASLNVKINPEDSVDFDMNYNVQGIAASMFNPYLISYTSFCADRGTLELNGNWTVRNGILKSSNHLLLIDPQVIRHQKNKDTKWIPLPLILSFVLERSNVIDYDIPVTGNLKDPKFHLSDVIFDLLKNLLLKPPTAPYRMYVRKTENKIKKSLVLNWEMQQSSLSPNQLKFINKMADFLVDNPDATIAVHPMVYTEKEKESILFFEAKKKYFLLTQHKKAASLTEDDTLIIENMSVKDSVFVRFVTRYVGNTLLFTMQDKCQKFCGTMLVNSQFELLCKRRKNAFMLSFKEKKISRRIKIHIPESNTPYNGFSFYKIVYIGDIPEALIKAYHQMDKLDHKFARKKFEKKRMQIKKALYKAKQLFKIKS
ncbi:MAG TPA: hypothetical protein DEH02_03260 [Bacteroidales bacterium]|nr:MAG: hypothetical protein A2X01_00770 [Bacteroidetes bacterium GWF2_35_48]OFZ04656.1 MAG: hypothetical protein A2491_11605 [Bacteroidetes bacterium RIFOXYC12_FULL_35_7]HBX50068.1 hypothetical protein [Bacteroidales bacterium]